MSWPFSRRGFLAGLLTCLCGRALATPSAGGTLAHCPASNARNTRVVRTLYRVTTRVTVGQGMTITYDPVESALQGDGSVPRWGDMVAADVPGEGAGGTAVCWGASAGPERVEETVRYAVSEMTYSC